jgi:hypothetical protein
LAEVAEAVGVDEDDAAFAAGFDTAPAQAAPETEPDAAAASAEPEPPAPPAKKLAEMTEEELRGFVAAETAKTVEELRSDNRKNFGQIGDIKRTLTDLQTKLAAGGSTAARKKLTAEALKRVNEELPGLGDALAQDLAEFLDSPAVAAEAADAKEAAEAKGQTFDPEAFFAQKIGPALGEIEARANARAERRILISIHRDFDAVVKSPEFSEWLKRLPPERHTEIVNSDDALVAADAVTEFKARAKPKQSTSSRLASAVPASGDRTPATHIANDDEADFEKGFKQVK